MGASVRGLLEEAIGFLGDEKPLHAIQILRKIISNDPECRDAYLRLAEIYIGMHHSWNTVMFFFFYFDFSDYVLLSLPLM